MADPNCENLFGVVQRLWPTCRMTPHGFEAIWDQRLKHYEYLEVAAALRRHRADDPDATKPAWRPVIDDLQKRNPPKIEEDGPSEAEIEAQRQKRNRYLDAMTDSELASLRDEALADGVAMLRRDHPKLFDGMTDTRMLGQLRLADPKTDDGLRAYIGGYLQEQGRL